MKSNIERVNSVGHALLNVTALIDEQDLSTIRQLFYPSRIAALILIHQRRTITLPELSEKLGLKTNAVQAALEVLVDLGFVAVERVANPGHGVVRVAISLLGESQNAIIINLLLKDLQKK